MLIHITFQEFIEKFSGNNVFPEMSGRTGKKHETQHEKRNLRYYWNDKSYNTKSEKEK